MTTYQIVGISLSLIVVIAASISLGITLCSHYFPRIVTIEEPLTHSVIFVSDFPGKDMSEQMNNAAEAALRLPKGVEMRIPSGTYKINRPVKL